MQVVQKWSTYCREKMRVFLAIGSRFEISFKQFIIRISPPVLHGNFSRLKASPIGFRLARGMFWSLIGTVISRGLALVSSVLVARMLGNTGYGELGIIQSTVGLFGIFAGLGLGLTSTKYVAEFRKKDIAKAGRIIVLSGWIATISGFTLTVAFFFSAPWLAANTLAAPQLGGLLQVGALLIVFGAVNGAQTGALSGFEAFKTIANINLWSGIASFPLMVVGVRLAGLTGAVWGLVGSLALNLIFNRIALNHEVKKAMIPLKLAGFQREFSILWNYSLPALISGFIVVPVAWICNTLLVNQPNGYAEMGTFSAANQWFTALMFLPGVLDQAVLPLLSERLGYGDKARSNRILKASIKVNIAVVFPMIIVGWLLSQQIMSVYGTGFQTAWPTLMIVLGTAGLVAVETPVSVIMQASGRMWLGALMSLGWGITFLIGTFLLARYGSTGLASARAIAYAFHAVWIFAFAFYSLRTSR